MFGWEFPSEWVQSINPLLIIFLTGTCHQPLLSKNPTERRVCPNRRSAEHLRVVCHRPSHSRLGRAKQAGAGAQCDSEDGHRMSPRRCGFCVHGWYVHTAVPRTHTAHRGARAPPRWAHYWFCAVASLVTGSSYDPCDVDVPKSNAFWLVACRVRRQISRLAPQRQCPSAEAKPRLGQLGLGTGMRGFGPAPTPHNRTGRVLSARTRVCLLHHRTVF